MEGGDLQVATWIKDEGFDTTVTSVLQVGGPGWGTLPGLWPAVMARAPQRLARGRGSHSGGAPRKLYHHDARAWTAWRRAQRGCGSLPHAGVCASTSALPRSARAHCAFKLLSACLGVRKEAPACCSSHGCKWLLMQPRGPMRPGRVLRNAVSAEAVAAARLGGACLSCSGVRQACRVFRHRVLGRLCGVARGCAPCRR